MPTTSQKATTGAAASGQRGRRQHWSPWPSGAAIPLSVVFALLCLATVFAVRNKLDLNEPAEGVEEWIADSTPWSPASRSSQTTPGAVEKRRRSEENLDANAIPSSHHSDKTQHKQQQQQGQPEPKRRCLIARIWDRTRDAIPNYFSFDWFVDKFKKHYSETEAMLRRNVFAEKVLDIFKWRVAFRLGLKSYTRAPNKFTDMTDNEFQRFYQRVPPPEFSGDPNYAKIMAERREHDRTERLGDEFLRTMPTQACAGGGSCQSNDHDELLARHKIDEYLEEQRREMARNASARELERLVEWAVRDEIIGVGFEQMTQSTADGTPKRSLPVPGQLPVPSFEPDKPVGTSSQAPYEPPKLDADDQDNYLDWSEHTCFHKVYMQNANCGDCYVQATTALAEFYSCATTLGPGARFKRRKFSKLFVLHCVEKFSPKVTGCTGGSPYETLRFLSEAGAHNIESWAEERKQLLATMARPLSALDYNCPLDTQTRPIKNWGKYKLSITPRQVHPNEWFEALQDGPLVASVQMPKEGVDSYAGGVHDGAGCQSSGFYHVMILVGYGVSPRGEPYWRFRNSFGPDWGDQGHFNLAMSVPSECLLTGVRVYRTAQAI